MRNHIEYTQLFMTHSIGNGYVPEQERFLIYFPLDAVTVLGPKVKELYDDFCNHRATNLKADENEIVSVEIDLNREKQT